jgi:pilus assembly protein Flp/PilA
MSRMLSLTRAFLREEEGVALIEYTVLLGIITVAVIGSIIFVGDWVGDQWAALEGSLP